ncbi:hypothetical protein PV-S19_0362 [Pacmanvirus S19]|nr:hypothetical protein PV-S19_0362 [Pacmanvirus S19]
MTGLKKKSFYYCMYHDDAFSIDGDDEITVPTCMTNEECDLTPIGYREYDQNGNIVNEDLPEPRRFVFWGGGFKYEYLSRVDDFTGQRRRAYDEPEE